MVVTRTAKAVLDLKTQDLKTQTTLSRPEPSTQHVTRVQGTTLGCIAILTSPFLPSPGNQGDQGQRTRCPSRPSFGARSRSGSLDVWCCHGLVGKRSFLMAKHHGFCGETPFIRVRPPPPQRLSRTIGALSSRCWFMVVGNWCRLYPGEKGKQSSFIPTEKPHLFFRAGS